MDCTTPPPPIDYIALIDLDLAMQYLVFGFCIGALPLSVFWSARLLIKQLFGVRFK